MPVAFESLPHKNICRQCKLCAFVFVFVFGLFRGFITLRNCYIDLKRKDLVLFFNIYAQHAFLSAWEENGNYILMHVYTFNLL